jgi:manganese/zinc/iron transport system permease protein
VWINYNTLVVLAGTSLLGACAGMIGSFAVLRRQALMGDALSHAALPGLCAAFLVLGERNLPAMLTGALLSGLLGVAVVTGLRRWTRIKQDAAIGFVLSVFFGAGFALSRWIQGQTTTGSKAGLDSYILGKTAGMIIGDVYWIAGVSAVCLVAVVVLYKEFKLVAFDTGFASAQGWPAHRLDLLLMGLVAVTVVLGLPAVGVVMMAALLILPGAAARFWTDRLSRMVMISAFFGVAVGAIGTAISATYSGLPAGPTIVLVGTALFLVSVLFAPRRGAVARALDQARFRRALAEGRIQLVIEDGVPVTMESR